MQPDQEQRYQNPVYGASCPDPFILKHRGEYWAYCTGCETGGPCIAVLHSRDLVHWRKLGEIMLPLSGDHPCYWAPEVVYENGKFYLYNRVGSVEEMAIRVAVADHPAGPFEDSGLSLTRETFAIEAHVYSSEDGLRPFTHAGQPRPVKKFPILRSLPEQGILGPGHNSVVRGPDNRQLFCAYHLWVQDAVQDPESASPQETAASSQPASAMAIDRLEWVGERLVVLGPTTQSQPIPIPPTLSFFYGHEEDTTGESPSEGTSPLPEGWTTSGGRWGLKNGLAVQADTRPGEVSEARLRLPCSAFLLETTLQSLSSEQRGPGAFGILLLDHEGDEAFTFELVPRPGRGTATGMVTTGSGEVRREQALPLPADFAPHVPHLARLELDGYKMKLAVDDRPVWKGRLPSLPSELACFSRNMAACFSACELTAGWEDDFWSGDRPEVETAPAGLGWETLRGEGDWVLRDNLLWHTNLDGRQAQIAKGPPLADYELVANLRLGDSAGRDGVYGFYPALGAAGGTSPLFTLEPLESLEIPNEWGFVARTPAGKQIFPLPPGFDPAIFQQFRFTKRSGRLIFQWESQVLGEMKIPSAPTRVGLYAHQAQVAVDLVRVTAIPPPLEVPEV